MAKDTVQDPQKPSVGRPQQDRPQNPDQRNQDPDGYREDKDPKRKPGDKPGEQKRSTM